MTLNEGWMIAGMMAVTFGIRYFLFALADRIRMAPWIEGSLKFIPPAVLTAGAASLLTLAMPYKLGIVISAFAGIAAGLMAQRIMHARKEALQG